jgi:DNA modification methylase
MTWEVRQGDCVELMAAMPEASVDAVVCDPPYGLEFMGREWDRLSRPSDANGFRRAENPADVGRDSVHGRLSRTAPEYVDSRARIRTRVDGRTNPAEGKSVTRTPEAYIAGSRMQVWHEAWAREALRVLKPGGFCLAFGGTRTVHRLACGIEDAGFEIRDRILYLGGGDADPNLGAELDWLYGSG